VENRTGGSTGSPLVFYHHQERLDSRQAATLRHNRWAGYQVGCKTAILWGHQRDLNLYRSFKARLRNLLLDRQLICDSGSFSEETLSRFARTSVVFRPEVIVAYAQLSGNGGGLLPCRKNRSAEAPQHYYIGGKCSPRKTVPRSRAILALKFSIVMVHGNVNHCLGM